MSKQIIFAVSVFITLLIFAYTTYKYYRLFKLTKKHPVKNWGKRIQVMLAVAIGQTKIMRFPIIGFLHALVFWGFCVILIGSIEMIIDGLAGTDRVLQFLGPVYDVIMASGDIFAFIIAISLIVFLFRRLFLNIKRFSGIEMKHTSHYDANIALSLIFLLMITLLGMNTFYVANHPENHAGVFPVSHYLANFFDRLSSDGLHVWHEVNWWGHILLIFLFANILPYSKHFHVFMSVPNVLLSRLEPLGYLSNMEEVTKEVKLMMDPNAAFDTSQEAEMTRFGVKDVEDVSWKSYLDSLACTECGRCTSVCPANITGKKLSPRKIIMDVRARMKDKGPNLIKDNSFDDSKALVKDYVSAEELWACTTCNACAQECPININHPTLIVDMRRYLVMEEAAGPGELNAVFSNIENNGAPWQFSPEDRLKWAEEKDISLPVMAEKFAKGEKPEYLLWIGSAGAFDDRYKKVSRSFIKILNKLNIDYAVLGKEESDSGDVARRAGNEMLFQMQAITNIEIFKGYHVKKILTCDPHDYNTFLNEYPDLNIEFEVMHHTQFLAKLLKEGKIKLNRDALKGKIITFHDPCYLGRANGEYQAPRDILKSFPSKYTEMKRCKSNALCCGAGGGQMFKEAEKGEKEVFIERIEEALNTKSDIIATACPYCMLMMTDGLKYKNKEEEIFNYDIAELVEQAMA